MDKTQREKYGKLIIGLLVMSIIIILNRIIVGDTYIFRFENKIDDYESVEVNAVKEGLVSVESIEVNGNIVSVELKGLKPGETQIEFTVLGKQDNSRGVISSFYIHKSGLITEGGYIGTCNNFYIIGIEMDILMLILLIHHILLCIRLAKKSMYSYSLVFHTGLTLFLLACFVLFMILSFRQKMVSYTLEIFVEILGILFWLFSFAALPILFIGSVFLLVSNIKLIKQEGIRLTNILGVLLGVFLFTLTISPHIFSKLLSSANLKYYSEVYYIQFFVMAFFGSLPVYLECLLASTLFCTIRAQKHVPKFDMDYIIILGCAIMDDGTVTPILKGRADRALWFANEQKKITGKDIVFVASGGQGSDEVVSEACAIKNYLISEGVDEDHIIVEDKSTSTKENMMFSKRLIDARSKDAKVAFSTTGYHVFRSGNIASSIGLDAAGVGSKTRWYFYINALIREFAANVSAEKKRHIINIIGLFIYAIIITILKIYTN